MWNLYLSNLISNLDNKVAYIFGDLLLQTEVLKQLSSMGRLVVCAGNGAVQSSANLYEISVIAELAARNFLCLYQLLQTMCMHYFIWLAFKHKQGTFKTWNIIMDRRSSRHGSKNGPQWISWIRGIKVLILHEGLIFPQNL